MWTPGSLAPNHPDRGTGGAVLPQQRMATLGAVMRHIDHGCGIIRDQPQHCPRRHALQPLARLQHWQRTQKPARIAFLIPLAHDPDLIQRTGTVTPAARRASRRGGSRAPMTPPCGPLLTLVSDKGPGVNSAGRSGHGHFVRQAAQRRAGVRRSAIGSAALYAGQIRRRSERCSSSSPIAVPWGRRHASGMPPA